MTESSNHLSQEVAVMGEVFAGLGERVLLAARELLSPGTPPPPELLDELTASHHDLESLRDRVRGLAGAFHVRPDALGDTDHLQGIAALLDHVAEAEIRHSRSDEIRRRAASVLKKVLSLSHVNERDFAPLGACQAASAELHTRLVEAHWAEIPSEAESLADGDHPLAHLLTMIEDRDEVSDEQWSQLHESVVAEFGKPLAAAAALREARPPVTSPDPRDEREDREGSRGAGVSLRPRATGPRRAPEVSEPAPRHTACE